MFTPEQLESFADIVFRQPIRENKAFVIAYFLEDFFHTFPEVNREPFKRRWLAEFEASWLWDDDTPPPKPKESA